MRDKMTQLYVGNLSAEGDEKSIKALFGRYGNVREVLMKNGYSFVEFDNPVSADEAMRDLNGSDILGHPMIVEPAHQQRPSNRRKSPCGRVEVTDIPPHLNVQNLEGMFTQIGQVHKMEIEEAEFGIRKVIITYETQEQAQSAARYFGEGSEHSPRVTYIEGVTGMRTISPSNVTMRKGSPGLPNSPSKNSDFPLRILVPNEMVGAIIGKDGATIRLITQLTKARVDVHRRESLGTTEKAVTIIGPPECCTEACHHIMKIMQHELLVTSGVMDTTQRMHEPLPVVPLKVLAHNELIGRVIGKGGNTLKRIMAESGTKITISKLKELTAYNMERTITILGTIDNCKKAESLISAKLRASYESDMAQFIPASEQNGMFNSPSPTNAPTPPIGGGPMPMSSEIGHLNHAQSLPATPTATSVRTFTDFSGEHTRITTLHGSTGALEVNNLGGFKLGPMNQSVNGTSERGKYSLESTIDGMVHGNGSVSEMSHHGLNGYTATNGMGLNGHVTNGRSEYNSQVLVTKTTTEVPTVTTVHRPFSGDAIPHSAGPLASTSGNFAFNTDYDDEISDVFSGLSFKEPPLVAAPGFGRSRLRRSSAPVGVNGFGGSGATNGYGLWSSSVSEHPLPGVNEGPEDEAGLSVPQSSSAGSLFQNSSNSSSSSNSSYNGGWGSGVMGGLGGAPVITSSQQAPQQPPATTSIWFGNSDSVTSGYSSSEQSSLSGFSPIYSPTASTGFGFTPTSRNSPTTSTGFGGFVAPTSRNSPVMMPGGQTSGMFSTAGFAEERDAIRSPFNKASIPTPLTTVSELGNSKTTFSTAYGVQDGDEEDLFKSIASATLGDSHQPQLVAGVQKW